MKLERGTIIQFSQGAYSDFHTCGLYVIIEDIENLKDYKKLVLDSWDLYANDWDEKESESDSNQLIKNSIGAHLIRTGKAIPLSVTEVHLGGYSSELGDLE